MRELEIRLHCGARLKIQTGREGRGFYLEVEQLDGRAWFTTKKAENFAKAEDYSVYFTQPYVFAYMANYNDLAKAFRDVADFIEGKSLVSSTGGNYEFRRY